MTSSRASRLLLGPISGSGEAPLFLQIVNRLKREVSEGRLAPGAVLPSFRQLAEDLLVSVITVKRAYEELEREGIIVRRQGLGTFVADLAADRSREAKAAHAEALFRHGAREAAEAGFTQQAALQLAHTAIREEAARRPSSQGALRHVRKRA